MRKIEAALAVWRDVAKSQGGPFIGPRGGKYADAQHKVAWTEPTAGAAKPTPNANHGLESRAFKDAKADINIAHDRAVVHAHGEYTRAVEQLQQKAKASHATMTTAGESASKQYENPRLASLRQHGGDSPQYITARDDTLYKPYSAAVKQAGETHRAEQEEHNTKMRAANDALDAAVAKAGAAAKTAHAALVAKHSATAKPYEPFEVIGAPAEVAKSLSAARAEWSDVAKATKP